MVEKILVYTPADPSGLWIHQAAAKELNSKDAQEMRNDFSMQVLTTVGFIHQHLEKQSISWQKNIDHRLSNLKDTAIIVLQLP